MAHLRCNIIYYWQLTWNKENQTSLTINLTLIIVHKTKKPTKFGLRLAYITPEIIVKFQLKHKFYLGRLELKSSLLTLFFRRGNSPHVIWTTRAKSTRTTSSTKLRKWFQNKNTERTFNIFNRATTVFVPYCACRLDGTRVSRPLVKENEDARYQGGKLPVVTDEIWESARKGAWGRREELLHHFPFFFLPLMHRELAQPHPAVRALVIPMHSRWKVKPGVKRGEGAGGQVASPCGRNEYVTNEPQRTSAGRLGSRVSSIKRILS